MESAQKQDAEQSALLVLKQFSEFALWLFLPNSNSRDSGELLVNLGIDRHLTEDWEPGRECLHQQRCSQQRVEGRTNVFHTLLISEKENISKFLLQIFDWDNNDINIPSSINLIPEEHVNDVWNQKEGLHFIIVRWGAVHFQSRLDSWDRPGWRTRIMWFLIKDDEEFVTKYGDDDCLIRLYNDEDQVENKKKRMEFLQASATHKYRGDDVPVDDVVKNLRICCQSDDIHLVCSYRLHSNASADVTTLKDNICRRGKPIEEATNFRELDLSLILPYFSYGSGMTNKEFANLLGELRQQFVKSLPSEHEITMDYGPQESLRRFDRNFLRLSNWNKDSYIMYDDRRMELNLVKFKSFPQTPDFVVGGYRKPSDVEFELIVRQNWVKYQCLLGQDDEFNIFRSLCFAPSSSVVERFKIGFVALTLQMLLSIGIAIDTMKMWSNKYSSFEDFVQKIKSFEYQFEDTLIVIISIFTFAFILQRLRKTIESFKQFYSNMKEVCIIPKVIIALDFTSNIIVGTFMAIVTPFFLLQSEDIQTVVLNSFALTFFIELDDLANTYESDEPFLLQEDKNGWEFEWYDPDNEPGVVKRKIEGLGSLYKSIKTMAAFVFSPLYETLKIIVTLLGMCTCCYRKKQNQDQVFQKWIDSEVMKEHYIRNN